MKVILTDNIRGIGRVGDIREVSDGYARNFLLPRQLARPLTDGAIKDVESVKAKKLAAAALISEQLTDIKKKIDGAVVTMSAKANDTGTLFASIEPSIIAGEISKIAGARLDESDILADGHIKTIGDHAVKVKLGENETAELTVRVIR